MTFTDVNDIPIPLNAENILKQIDEYSILRYYLGHDFNLRENYRSLLREDDKKPSLNFYINSHGTLRFKDFGGKSGNCFQFVMELFNTDYSTALKRINQDFNLGLGGIYSDKERPVFYHDKQRFQRKNTKIQIKTRVYNGKDLMYWHEYGINLDVLNMFNVYCTNKVYINKKLIWIYIPANPIFTYYFESENRCKVYRPLDEVDRWLCDTNCIQGYDQLPDEGELLIITSSLKDAMVWYSHGFNAVAPQSESTHIPKEMVEELGNRFTNILINFDNDSTGKRESKRLEEQFQCNSFFTPMYKDLSMFRKEEGPETTSNLLKEFK